MRLVESGRMSDPRNRRQFFRESFHSILKPVAEFLADKIDLTDATPRTLLRPPGAIREAEFLEVCYRCGNCAEVCPADAIKLYACDDDQLNRTPVIDPDIAACVICDDLACMNGCPSGALVLVDSPHSIRMGLAVMTHSVCVRSHGEDCTKCIELCPLGESAIRLDASGKVEVLDPGCVGCGVCQFHCPTDPKAITIAPL